jgi:hypothetical protein
MGNNLIRPYSNRYRQRVDIANVLGLNSEEIKHADEKEGELLITDVNIHINDANNVDEEKKSIESSESDDNQSIASNINSRSMRLFNCLEQNARECFVNSRYNNNMYVATRDFCFLSEAAIGAIVLAFNHSEIFEQAGNKIGLGLILIISGFASINLKFHSPSANRQIPTLDETLEARRTKIMVGSFLAQFGIIGMALFYSEETNVVITLLITLLLIQAISAKYVEHM